MKCSRKIYVTNNTPKYMHVVVNQITIESSMFVRRAGYLDPTDDHFRWSGRGHHTKTVDSFMVCFNPRRHQGRA